MIRASAPPPPARMHVMHVIASLGRGGAERMLVDLANRTAADGHRVSVCTTRRDEHPLAADLRPDIERLSLDRTRSLDPAALIRLAAHAARQGVTVLHVHLRSTLAFVGLAKALRLVRIPVVLHDHDGEVTNRHVPAWFRLWGRRFAQRYVGVCDELASWGVSAGIPGSHVSVIENALDLDRLRASDAIDVRREFGLPVDATVGILLAHHRPHKGIEVLIDAAARSRHRDRLRILNIGMEWDGDYSRRLRDGIAERGLQEVIRFVGSRADVPRILGGADFAVLSSHAESGPLALLEYMACGLPLVATRTGQIGRRAEELGIEGIVVPGDADALTDALDALLGLEPEARRARGRRGRDLAFAHWDVASVMPRWYAVYASALAGVTQ